MWMWWCGGGPRVGVDVAGLGRAGAAALVGILLCVATQVHAFQEIWLPVSQAIPNGTWARIDHLSASTTSRLIAYTGGHLRTAGTFPTTDCLTWHRTLPADYTAGLGFEVLYSYSGRCTGGADTTVHCWTNNDCAGNGTCTNDEGTPVNITQLINVNIGCRATGVAQTYADLDVATGGATTIGGVSVNVGRLYVTANLADAAIVETGCNANNEAAIQLCLGSGITQIPHFLGLRLKYPCSGGTCP